jgi:UV excision repair protein RAD23
VTLTPEDVEAVERLCALGFDRNRAIEAYIACDKNEMMAANYLFESNDDDYN